MPIPEKDYDRRECRNAVSEMERLFTSFENILRKWDNNNPEFEEIDEGLNELETDLRESRDWCNYIERA